MLHIYLVAMATLCACAVVIASSGKKATLPSPHLILPSASFCMLCTWQSPVELGHAGDHPTLSPTISKEFHAKMCRGSCAL
jgi:hypothetical protein